MSENGKKRKRGSLRKQARRDVRLASQPYLNQLERAARQTRDETKEAQARVGSIYDALQTELAPLPGLYDTSASKIAGDLTGQIGSLEGLLGISPSAAPGEGAAAANVLGSMGSSALAGLASDRSRQIGYQASTQRQAGIERATLRRNYLEDMNDILDDIRNQRLDLKADWQSQILQRLDALRQQRFDKEIAKRIAEQNDKRFDWEGKDRRRSIRQERKGRQAANEILTEAQQRKQLSSGIQRLLDEIGKVNKQIAPLKFESGNYRNMAEWQQEALPEIRELRGERRELKQKVKTKRRKKRRL